MRSNFAVLWKFKTYLDKRWVGGSKMPIFVHVYDQNVLVEVDGCIPTRTHFISGSYLMKSPF